MKNHRRFFSFACGVFFKLNPHLNKHETNNNENLGEEFLRFIHKF